MNPNSNPMVARGSFKLQIDLDSRAALGLRLAIHEQLSDFGLQFIEALGLRFAIH